MNNQCSSCFEPINPGDEIFVHTPKVGPGHKFHAQCQINWAESCRRYIPDPIPVTCPMCKAVIGRGTADECIEEIAIQNMPLWKRSLARGRQYIPSADQVLVVLSPIDINGNVRLVATGLLSFMMASSRNALDGRLTLDTDDIARLVFRTMLGIGSVYVWTSFMVTDQRRRVDERRAGTRRKKSRRKLRRGGNIIRKKIKIDFSSEESIRNFFDELNVINNLNSKKENPNPYYIIIDDIEIEVAKTFLKALNINDNNIVNIQKY